MANVVQSTNAARPSRQVTMAISDKEAALIPSRTAPAVTDLRIRGTKEPLTATKKKAGRNIPTAPTSASVFVLSAARPSPHNAYKMIAMTTGFTPYRRASVCGSEP